MVVGAVAFVYAYSNKFVVTVSEKPKRLAWTLGMSLALAMTIITNGGAPM